MKPLVVIATHQRLDITTKNIQSLLKQSLKPEIVLVCSDTQDLRRYENMQIKELHLFQYQNRPLGAKWQYAVSQAKNIPHDFLVILGSDDILGKDYILNASKAIESGVDFIGLMRFWQHHKGRAYLCDYLPILSIGGGRVYSKRALQKLNYRLFENKERHLDNYAWDQIRNTNLKVRLIRDIEGEGFNIHAIKGDWQVMNPFTIKHKNIRLLRSVKWDEQDLLS